MPPPSRLCLSRDGSRGAPAPTHSLVSRQGRRVGRTPSWSGTSRALHSYIWGRGAAQSSRRAGHRAGSARATSCHRPSSPPPLRLARPGSLGQGGADQGRPHLFVCPTPPSPVRERPGRAPWSQPGGRHVAEPGARPPGPSGTHSGAAAAPASWGLSGLPAPRPARSPRPCRASVRPAGSQPSRAVEGTKPTGEIRAPAAAPSCLAAGGPDLGAGRAGTAGAGLPRPPTHWASQGLGGSRPRRPRPCAQPALPSPRREAQLDQRLRRVSPTAARAPEGRSWRGGGAPSAGLPIKTRVSAADTSLNPKGLRTLPRPSSLLDPNPQGA